MTVVDQKTDRKRAFAPNRFSQFRAVARSRDGAAAIEFALLAIPYFLVIFAILETFIAFAAEELVSNAVDTMSRRMRTGQITYNLGRTTDMSRTQFRQAFCNEISILISCSTSEAATPSKLYVDVQTFGSFSAIPTTIPKVSSDRYADINTAAFKYTPGGAGTINMLRAYYRWEIITDLVRPYITTIRPSDGSMPTQYLIIATSAFQNEQYP
ncbi:MULTISPECIES: TadE/TadG family type IV pilus assembly protein [Rhizobium]|jgi:Flp pilus assembly protein TadG|uniref:TadE/TadG family type IV pilus assembly protein n=1 Tax=Rhizobium TaxID=379 RepID=UPI0007EA1BBC|nr:MULTISPECIES: TadE/TadG family type IV pilus assembly protein [Rhizobium]ANK83860.1 Flp pilus assembly TadG-like protein [Rhizobium sp. N731]ANK89753.1 Flp pilus assembly TadG-like protein [Rhizobium sp. N6212]ANK95780.1 Flp pilus assembly TadG-like protein [Rhizobium sp. N621]ANL01808.1 Flp pilus assembly TadG-like protein [Rhizobium esperanzae]ANL07936.1 Flp pilus assembly TadG-like protein [Rhizobium sp. N1341]